VEQEDFDYEKHTGFSKSNFGEECQKKQVKQVQ